MLVPHPKYGLYFIFTLTYDTTPKGPNTQWAYRSERQEEFGGIGEGGFPPGGEGASENF